MKTATPESTIGIQRAAIETGAIISNLLEWARSVRRRRVARVVVRAQEKCRESTTGNAAGAGRCGAAVGSW